MTEPSPEAPLLETGTLVHVLVHRESEEYNTSDVEENYGRAEVTLKRPPDIKISPGSDEINYPDMESIVKIMVESPKEPPQLDYSTATTTAEAPMAKSPPPVPPRRDRPAPVDSDEIQVVPEEPIDVNMPVDTTNLFYHYEGPQPAETAPDTSSNVPDEERS